MSFWWKKSYWIYISNQKNRPRHNIRMFWTNFWRATVHVQQKHFLLLPSRFFVTKIIFYFCHSFCYFCHVFCFTNFFCYISHIFYCFCHVFCSTNIFCYFCNVFCLLTFFVTYVTFFTHVSTPRTTTRTTKLLLGPLSVARGQKTEISMNFNMIRNFRVKFQWLSALAKFLTASKAQRS